MLRLALVLLLVSAAWADTYTSTLHKEYNNDQKILDANGNYIDNPNFGEDGKHLHDVHNEQDLIYYGDVYFWKETSDEPERLQVIMDTGSSWLWAPSSICRGCPSDDSLDHSYLVNRGEGVKSIQYGSGGISGDIVRGMVSLSPKKEESITDYKMLEVTQASLPGLEGSNWDGILGLLPTSISGSDLFVTELYKAGLIKRDAFGVHYTDTASGSEITFGGFDTSIVEEEDDFTFVDLHDGMHWSGDLKRIKYGAFGELPDKAKVAILDSGTSLILVPQEIFDGFTALVSDGRKCGQLGVYYGCYCDSKYDFDPLYFWFGNYEYKASPEHYIVETWTNRQRFCYFLIQGSSIKKNSIILGDAFLRNYYVYHDVENERMGLYGDYMLYYRPEIFTTYFWIVAGLALFCALLLVCCLYYCCVCKSSKPEDEERLVGRDHKPSELGAQPSGKLLNVYS